MHLINLCIKSNSFNIAAGSNSIIKGYYSACIFAPLIHTNVVYNQYTTIVER